MNTKNYAIDNPATIVLEYDNNKAPEISVVIVSWNALDYLKECLESLSTGVNCLYEVIVVDNDSSDGSPEMVASDFPWVVLIQTGDNLGFSKGNNVGIRRARGQYIALVNSDVNVFPGCLDNLSDFLDKNQEVGMVGPKIYYGDRVQQSSCRRFPNVWNNLCEVFRFNRIFPKSEFFGGEHMFFFDYEETREVEVLVGCFILARKKAMDEFGLLDEDFFMYGEDLDWSRRCRQSGWKISFFPGAEAIHYCGGSSSNQPQRFSIAQLKSRVLLWRKHLGKLSRIALILLALLQSSLRLTTVFILWLLKPKSREFAAERASMLLGTVGFLLQEFSIILFKRPKN